MAEASNELIVQILRDVQATQAAQGRDIADIKTDLSEFKTEMYEFKSEMFEFKTDMYEFKAEMYEFRDSTTKELALMRASIEALREMIFQINVAIRVIDERLRAVEA